MVSPARKQTVPKDFDAVASTYDLLTGLNPGYHRHLRRSAERLSIRRLSLGTSHPRLLDLCCGTGASTEALKRVYPDADIVGLDASSGMLAEAQAKPGLDAVDFRLGDATDPRSAGITGDFDGVFMAYGIRNLPDPDRALENVRALLRPGGTAVFHEYSVADSRVRSAIWDAVCLGIIVPGGMLTARSSDLYRYLHRSVRGFDGVKAFEARMMAAGFLDVWTGAMDGWQRGVVHSFVGRVP